VNWRTDALAYANACHVAEVEVDIETGAVHILNYTALQDSGVLINPMLVDGQVQGGIAHGIGNALYEWMGYDDDAQPVTTTFADYLLPTACEVPAMTTLFKETPSPLNPLGAKGAGEVSTIPTAAAVIAAVEHALQPFGVRIEQVPVTPQKLVELISGGNGSAGH
jgi:carbon-monoxide dehydrogenase large subunit